MSGAFSEDERAAVYRVIAERRDVRRGFVERPLEDAVLGRLLGAAHQAPSVGLMQPTRFVVVRDAAVRRRVHAVFCAANAEAGAGYAGRQRELYAGLKLEGLLECPQHLCVLCDAESAQGSGLGRVTMPETALYSSVCAVENLWLAARAEGVGVGWVSILDLTALRQILAVPERLTVVAYLCVGYCEQFGDRPDLEAAGWEQRREPAVSVDRCGEDWGQERSKAQRGSEK